MTDTQLATMAEVFLAVLGMLFALVAGYVMGYKDARKHQEMDQ